MAFSESSVLLNLEESEDNVGAPTVTTTYPVLMGDLPLTHPSIGQKVRGSTVRLSFIGSEGVTPEGRLSKDWYGNYFLGADPAGWAIRVPSYREVVYVDLYPGIDLVYRQEGHETKYEYIVHPGADPCCIVTKVEGHESLTLDEGDLVISTSVGELRDSGLNTYYMDDPGERVPSEFKLLGSDTFGFHTQDHDATRAIVIDPILYSTFLGGSHSDRAGVTVGPDGAPVMSGMTESDDFPTVPGSYQVTHNGGQYDCFVSKFSPNGTSLVFSTFIGGSSYDYGGVGAIDSSGAMFVSGSTESDDFPTTPGAFQETYGGGPGFSDGDCFLLKLNATGDGLAYSTYVGSDDDDDQGGSITLASDGSAIMSGITRSGNFPVTLGAFQTTHNGGRELFICKINPQGTNLVFSTFLGGSEHEGPGQMTTDSKDNVYICGDTGSDDFPVTPGAFQITLNGRDNAFIAKLSADGASLIFCTYLGGDGGTDAHGILVDDDNTTHVTGYTGSTDFPTTPGVYKTLHTDDETDIFVTHLDENGTDLLSSTLIGGERGEGGVTVVLDEQGNVCLCGSTASSQFPTTKGAPQKVFGGDADAVVCKLSADYSKLLFSTYVGGSDIDEANSIDFQSPGMAWVGGHTRSRDFPTTKDALQASSNGQELDGFLCMVVMDTLAPVAEAGPDVTIDQHQTMVFNGTNSTDDTGIVNWTWSFQYDGRTVTLHNSTAAFTFHKAGSLTVTLCVWDLGNNTGTDEMDVTVVDITPPVAEAGSVRIVDEDLPIVLDGTRSIDNVGVVNWTWTFDYNGTKITLFGPDPGFTFHEPGEYNITLNVTDARGLWDTDHVTVHVLDVTDPVAAVSDDVTVDQHEVFIMNGIGSTDNVAVVNWTWGFVYRGFPMVLHGEVVEFTFDDAGVFEVTLTVSDAAGNTDMAVFHVTVVDTTPPVAVAGGDREVNPGTSVSFDGRGSSDNVRIASFSWTFVYQGQDIQLDGSMPSYFFEAAGAYVVTLTVTDTAGHEDTDTMNVTVLDLVHPVADAGEDVTVDQRTFVILDSSGSTDNVGIVSWSWTFLVDGEPVTSENPVWEACFAEAGEYEVTLRVEDAAGLQGEDTMTVTVRDTTRPVASSLENMTTEQGEEVTLDGSASTDNVGVVNWTWTIDYHGSKDHIKGRTTTYVFSSPGSYMVTLTVEDAAGNSNWSSLLVRVLDNVVPTLPRLRDVESTPGQEVILDGSGATDNVGVVNWTWTFEEGGEAVVLEGMTVEHTFDEPGEYEVTLTVVDADGNEATGTFTVTVSSGVWLWAVVGLVVVVALVAFVLWRRSRD